MLTRNPDDKTSFACVVTVDADASALSMIDVPDDTTVVDGVYEMEAGDTLQLSSSVPSGVWRTSDYSTMEVDASNGLLTALSPGLVTVPYEVDGMCDVLHMRVVGGVPVDYEVYYAFLDDGTGEGWQLRLTDGFRNAINLDGAALYHNWYAGQPLPAFPKEHEGKPVTSLAYVLADCDTASSLDVSKWDTSGIRDMSYLFKNCAFVQLLNLLGFDTSSVETRAGMFSGCTRLLSLDLRSFDTNMLGDTSEMFRDCGQFEHLNISRFDLSRVVTAQNMFARCFSLKCLDANGFYIRLLQNAAGMFADMRKLQILNLRLMDCRQLTDNDENTSEILASSSMRPGSIVFEPYNNRSMIEKKTPRQAWRGVSC